MEEIVGGHGGVEVECAAAARQHHPVDLFEEVTTSSTYWACANDVIKSAIHCVVALMFEREVVRENCTHDARREARASAAKHFGWGRESTLTLQPPAVT